MWLLKSTVSMDSIDTENWSRNVRVSTRFGLKKILRDGRSVYMHQWVDGVWQIPKWRFCAPNSKFAETDESFKEIVTKNPEKIRELDKIDDMDEFIRQSFDFIKWEMGLNPDIELMITDDDNYYNVIENSVNISRNWAWHVLKHVRGHWDKAEIFWWIVHEFNHYLQRKEFILNFDVDSPYRNKIINELRKSSRGYKNIEYIVEHYLDNMESREKILKAKKYGENRERYVLPKIDEKWNVVNYWEYKWQLVEFESFKRWDMIVEEYRKAISGDENV